MFVVMLLLVFAPVLVFMIVFVLINQREIKKTKGRAEHSAPYFPVPCVMLHEEF